MERLDRLMSHRLEGNEFNCVMYLQGVEDIYVL